MSKSIKAFAIVSLVLVVAACGNRNNQDDEPVMVEPVTEEEPMGKF